MEMILKLYKWILVLLILCGSHQVSVAGTFGRVAQPADWGYKTVFSDDIRPSYAFHSTSSCNSVLGNTSTNSILSEGITSYSDAWNPWGDEDPEPTGNPVGTLDNPTPIGEPLILVVLAIMYLLFRRARLKRKNHLSCLCS